MPRLLLALLPLVLTACNPSGPTPPAPKTAAVEARNAALAALAQNDTARALAEARTAWEHDPDYADGIWLYASLLGRMGQYEEALARCRELRAAHPEYVQGHLLEGILWDRRGNRDEAHAAYDRALAGFAQRDTTGMDKPAYRLYEALTIYLRHGKIEGVQAINRVLDTYPDFRQAAYIKSAMLDRDRSHLLRWFSHHAERPAPGDSNTGPGGD